MCSIVLITQQRDMNALIVAANRDEKLDRPAGDPRIDENSPIARIRPVDEAQGGTWLGLNAMGVFAGITNRFMAPNDPTRSSRGSLPLLALEEPWAVPGTPRGHAAVRGTGAAHPAGRPYPPPPCFWRRRRARRRR